MYEIDLSQLDDIYGADGTNVHLLPKEVIQLQVEVMSHHPELKKELDAVLPQDNFDPATFYGIIGAYCNIVLDGSYDETYLCEQLRKALVDKRVAICINSGVNTVKVSKALLQ